MFYETINQNALRPLTSNVAWGNYYNINELPEPTREDVNFLDDIPKTSDTEEQVEPDPNGYWEERANNDNQPSSNNGFSMRNIL